MQELLACEEEEVQEDLRLVRRAAAIGAAAQPTAEPEPSSAVALAAAALALAALAAVAAIRATHAARLPPDSWRLLHDRERLLRRRPHLEPERVRGRRHGARPVRQDRG
eukprot:scaffold38122_cov64-Phaeocystis_antarctica.AAC.5